MTMESDLERHYNRTLDKLKEAESLAAYYRESADRSLEMGLMMSFPWAEKIKKDKADPDERPMLAHWGEVKRAKVEAAKDADEDHQPRPGKVKPDAKGVVETYCDRDGCNRTISPGPTGRWHHTR